LLEAGGYKGEVILINGTNADPLSARIYAEWVARHKGEPIISGSKPVDIKAAIVEDFRERATILVATEAAAEGINLQFCSLVVNYDLPWNPQRVEQRIGRCHRYGQQHDVVVVNFVNLRNAADKRVFDILSEKFKLFDGVFGASDEVLGVIGSGVDIERRIAMVFQSCRTEMEIEHAFKMIQDELEEEIKKHREKANADVLSNFDEDVQARLKLHRDETETRLTKREEQLRALTFYELKDAVHSFEDGTGFEYKGNAYYFSWKNAEEKGAHFYRVDHPVAAALLDTAEKRVLSPTKLTFHLNRYPGTISLLEAMKGHSGWLEVSRVAVKCTKTGEQTDDELLLYAVSDNGIGLDQEMCEKLLSVPAIVSPEALTKMVPESALMSGRNPLMEKYTADVEHRNAAYFEEKILQLDRWTDSLRVTLKKELESLDEQVKACQKAERAAGTMPEKLQKRREKNTLEAKRDAAWKKYDMESRELERQKEQIVDETARKLEFKTEIERIFAIRWTIA
jgi:adenine-specific DNA-methyltransferase